MAGAASGSVGRTSHTITGPGRWTAISETSTPDGRVTDTWRGSDGSMVSAIGPPGLHLTVVPDPDRHGPGNRTDHGVTIAIQGAGLTKKAGATATAGAAGDLRLARSVYSQPCFSYTNPSGHVYFYGCDTQWLDQTYGYDWYMFDQQQVSGRSDCSQWFWCDRLTQLYNYVSYSAGNGVIQWSPDSTTSVGSCRQQMVGITSPQSGLGYSETSTVCPNTFGPYVLNSTQFGAVWNGYEGWNDDWESSMAEDLVHNPPGYWPSFNYNMNVSWCNWCTP